jgi:hypothetical protein
MEKETCLSLASIAFILLYAPTSHEKSKKQACVHHDRLFNFSPKDEGTSSATNGEIA